MIATADVPATAISRRTVLSRLAAIPAPRRFPATVAIIASAGVFATSLRALPPGLLLPLAAAWLGAFAAGALLPGKGAAVLTVLASLTKPATLAMIFWAVTNPHSPLGPHTMLDWVPLGSLNMATTLWLVTVIRRRAR